MRTVSVPVIAGLALVLSACGTVDLEADPLLMPPQLVEPADPEEEESAVVIETDVTLTV